MEHDSNQNGSMNEMNFQTEIEIWLTGINWDESEHLAKAECPF